jgi:hypothetical protein
MSSAVPVMVPPAVTSAAGQLLTVAEPQEDSTGAVGTGRAGAACRLQAAARARASGSASLDDSLPA